MAPEGPEIIAHGFSRGKEMTEHEEPWKGDTSDFCLSLPVPDEPQICFPPDPREDSSRQYERTPLGGV